MRIYLLRHGETDYNRERRMQGYSEVPLNDRGIQQIARLASRLASLPVDHIYSSDLRRAVMSAAIVAAYTGAPLTYDRGLRERNPGALTHLTYEEAEPFFSDPDYEPPEGESVPEFDRRVRETFEALIRREAGRGRHVGVVTHGMVCASFARQFGGLETPGAGRKWPNGSLTIADYNGVWNIRDPADTAHLGGLSNEAADAGA